MVKIVSDSLLSSSDKELLERTLAKLEQFYPEHKTYAMDALCSQQRENISKLSIKLGYSDAGDFLRAHGFEPIRGADVYELRKNCGIKPGEEPDLIKERVENAITKLNEYYPDHVIEGSIQKDYKKLAGNLTGFYQWLGYRSLEDMLSAYGFTYNAKVGRKVTVDPEAIVAELKKRYPNGTSLTMGELKDNNPDLKLKSLMNMAQEIYGMSLAKYLFEQGLLLPFERTPKKSLAERQQHDKEYKEERKSKEDKEYFDECIDYYQRAYFGWKPLCDNAESLMQTHIKEKSKRKVKNILNSRNEDPDQFFKTIGVIKTETTDNELREKIQNLDFTLFASAIGIQSNTYASLVQEGVSEITKSCDSEINRPKIYSAAGFSEEEEEEIAKYIEKGGDKYLFNFVTELDCLIFNPECTSEPLKMKKAKLLEKRGANVEFISFEDLKKNRQKSL